jgi:two-component system response regulator FixJ
MSSDSKQGSCASGSVFIVDDDASFLRALSRLLRAAGYTVETYESAKSFLERTDPNRPGCVVADLQMPEMNGIELQEALGRTANPLPIVFLSGQGDIPTTVRAMRKGAVDFLTKYARKEDVLSAVERALGRHAGERAKRERLQTLRERFDALSSRESEVLSYVLRGKLNKQIAAELSIHERTVKLHRTSITRKLRVHSVAELTRLAGEAGLFRPGVPS